MIPLARETHDSGRLTVQDVCRHVVVIIGPRYWRIHAILTEFELDEETLDPDNPDDLRALGHYMLDDMFDCVAGLRERPAWQSVPEEICAAFQVRLPTDFVVQRQMDLAPS